MRHRIRLVATLGLTPITCLLLGLGCTGLIPRPGSYDYFTRPDPRDAWSPKIAGWQRREFAEEKGVLTFAGPATSETGIDALLSGAAVSGADSDGGSVRGAPASVSAAAELRSKYFAFRAERKRNVARRLAEWIQGQAKQHYVADGPVDHWATLEETLRGNGDDCDGLELLVYHALRDLGFGRNEVYRSIVYRPSDSQHHMVTLWFEDPEDPWVIDPTGAMTPAMVRMSALPAWVPLKVFSETTEFTVRPASDATELASSP